MKIKPRKSLGQHFLHDNNILDRICQSVKAAEDERVIEIGPGEGALTRFLLHTYSDVTAVELDSRAVELLETEFPQLNLIQANILKTSWDEILKPDGKNVVVGNIPYYITSPILFKIMDAGAVIRRSVLLMQKEVAERLVSGPGTKSYGILSVQAQLLGKVEYLFTVSRHVFHPKPKVESAVIVFEPHPVPPEFDVQQMKSVVRMAFNQRRKKLSNSLKTLIDGRENIEFDLNLRPDQLSPEDFIKLTNAVFTD